MPGMGEHRFINPSQPQTLYGATLLCYIDAVFGLLGSRGHAFGLLLAVALAAGGFGIANEKRWGYGLALAGACLQLLILIAVAGIAVLGFPIILTLMFDVLLVALLVHPMSRDYQRIWFR